jgi:hypothetical protein
MAAPECISVILRDMAAIVKNNLLGIGPPVTRQNEANEVAAEAQV